VAIPSFRANLENASPRNNQGIWRTRNGAAELLVRKGDVAIPATESSAEAIFQVFPSNSIVPGILIDDSDQVVFAAELAGDDITPQLNSFTVWSSRDGELNLLYQRGMPAPGTHDTFSTSGIHFATNAVGQLVLRGRAGTKDGIWAQDPSGELRLVVLAGDQVPIGNELRTITSIGGLPFSGGSDGRARIINDAGEIVFVAGLDDGTAGVFVSNLAGYVRGDFNRDGIVDGDDLVIWEASFGQDESMVVGRRDFLIWQRQHTGSLAPLVDSQMVPEPVRDLS